MKYFIVWNEEKTEGFITDEKREAEKAATGKFTGGPYSTLGEKFHETYEDEELPRLIEVIDFTKTEIVDIKSKEYPDLPFGCSLYFIFNSSWPEGIL